MAPLCLCPRLFDGCQWVPGACPPLHREPKVAAEAARGTFSLPGGGGSARPVPGSPRVPVLGSPGVPVPWPREPPQLRLLPHAGGTGAPISSHSPPAAAVHARDRSMGLAFALRLLGSCALLLATAPGAQGKGDQQVCTSGAFLPWPAALLLLSLLPLLLFPVEADRSPVLVLTGPQQARP